MKLFQNNNIDIVNYCRAQFEFDLPSTVVEKRSKKFVAKYRSCETAIHLHNLFHCCCCCLSFFVLLSAVLFFAHCFLSFTMINKDYTVNGRHLFANKFP